MIIARIFNTFIPQNLSKDTLKASYAENLVGACIISIFASPIYAAIYFYLHYYTAAYVIFFNEFILLLPLITLRYLHSLLLSGTIFVCSLVGLLFWLTVNLGGIYSSTAYWLVLPALIAAFIGGMRFGFICCTLAIVATSIIYYLEYIHFPFPISPITDPLLLQYLGICGLTLVILSLAYFYEMTKQSSLVNLQNIAYRDLLTQLPNRMAYEALVDSLIQHADDTHTAFTVFSIDIDNFKSINMIFGKEAGDLVLQEIASRIQHHLQYKNHIARVGGDEFRIIIEAELSKKTIDEIAHILLAMLKIPFHIKETEINITVNMGIASYQLDTPNDTNVEHYAEIALLKAKKIGRNNYQHYIGLLKKEADLELMIEKHLLSAIENNELSFNFQPIINVKNTDEIIGFEVLLRWYNHDLGNVSPAVFIPVAERIDLISKIDKWVLKQACKQFKAWLDTQLFNQDFIFSVNMSARRLYDDDFIHYITDTLKETGITPRNIILELTETAILTDQSHAIAVLQKLKEMGIQTLIDDFGVGQTSLSYLSMLPVAGLKIDKTFVDTMLTKGVNNDIIVAAIIDLAHKLHFKVIAEGIEAVEQLNYLRDMNCDYVQGFYLCEPLAIQDIPTFLKVQV